MTVSRSVNWFNHSAPVVFLVLALGFWLASVQRLVAAEPSEDSIVSISISQPFFNPSLGQKVAVSFSVQGTGSLTVAMIDADGRTVRRLLSGKAVGPGRQVIEWDGRDDRGKVVPNEAYSPEIQLVLAGERPESVERPTPKVIPVRNPSYDPASGVLSYALPSAARVWIEASAIKVASGSPSRLVKRVIVDGVPRVAGSVIDQWNGFDDTKSLFLPQMKDFAVTAHAVTLPDDVVITIGSREPRD